MTALRIVPSLFIVCLLASSNATFADELSGVWPTCWEPWEVEQANTAWERQELATFRKFKCGLFGEYGTPVHVIRCAADVTPEEMKRYFDPVPRDDRLPGRVCEVEVFEDGRSKGIYYTYYFNINFFESFK